MGITLKSYKFLLTLSVDGAQIVSAGSAHPEPEVRIKSLTAGVHGAHLRDLETLGIQMGSSRSLILKHYDTKLD